MPGVPDPFYYTMEKGIKAAADKAGADLVVAEYPKAWGPENQIPILQATYARGKFDSSSSPRPPPKPSRLRSRPSTTRAPRSSPSTPSSATATIPRPTDYSFPLSYIGSDNFLGGKQMAEQLAKMVGEKGKVYFRPPTPTPPPSQGRVKGLPPASPSSPT